METQTPSEQQPTNTPSPTLPGGRHFSKQQLTLSGVFCAVLIIGGGITWALTRSNSESATQSATSTPAETCAPRNTSICGPDGKPIGQAKVAAGSVKKLDNVTVSKVKLSGTAPQGLDIDPATGYAYISNNGTIIAGCSGDTSHGNPGAAPAQAVIAEGASTLSIIDPGSGKELTRVATQSAPIWPLVDNQRGVVYVAGSGDGMVGIHRLGTGEKIDSIHVGGRPHAFGLKGSTLIVSNTHDTTQTYMTLINPDTRQAMGAQSAPEFPHGIVFDGKKNVFYMVGVKTGSVAIVDAASGKVTGALAGASGTGNSNMLAFSEKTRRLFISDTQSQSSITVVDVDSQKKLGTIGFTQSSSPVWGMQVDDGSGLLYAALPNSDAVGVAEVSSLKALGLVPVDTCPYAVRLDTARDRAVTTNQVNATASVFKLSDVKKSLGR